MLYEIKDLSFFYENQVVLESLSFSIKKGEVFCIVGPNGAGKTTLLKLLLGLLLPSKGKVFYNQKPISSYTQDNFPIGYLPQMTANLKLNSKLLISVKDMIDMGIAKKLSKKERENKINSILEFLQIQDLASKIFFNLSGGQQQKALLARALVQNPQTLILDEPSLGVDNESQKRLFSLLKTLNKEKGITIILVSHDLSVIPAISHRVACLNKNIFVHENPQEFATCPTIQQEMASGLELLIHGTHIPHRTVFLHQHLPKDS